MIEQLALLPDYLTAHLKLTLVALLFGIGVSVPLGIAISRKRWLEQPVLGVASVIQTIPSLALLAFMVPALAALGLQSIGYLPAIIGLLLYCILPILRNTVAGLAGVDPALVEAAKGVGMTSREQLLRVELPLAMPVIIAGIRTSTVWTVGIATLSTPVGAPSLGNYIFSGLQTRNYNAVLVGCIAAASLALLLDGLIRALELGIRQKRRIVVGAALTIVGLLYVMTAFSFAHGLIQRDQDKIKVGAKTFTEQYILSQIVSRKVRMDTNVHPETMESLGSTVAFDALQSGQIDIYVDYSGTLWTTILKRTDIPKDRSELLREVRQFLFKEHGIVVVAPLGFENTYALAMRQDQAESLGIQRISELVPHATTMSIGGDYEFFERPEWRAIEQAYNIKFAKQRSMDPSLMYQAVKTKEVDVISAFSTDGRIVSYHLHVLEDDRGAIPPYDAVILASAKLAHNHPEVVDALKGLEGKITADRMRQMNVAVDEQGETPAQVAEQFFREQSSNR